MYNCKSGDIAVITWDEASVFSNIGKLVRVDGPLGYDPCYGLTWLITPIDQAGDYFFIEEQEDNAVKKWKLNDDNIRHSDAWMRPLENTDDSFEEFIQEIVREAGQIKRHKEVITEACD